MKVLYVEDDSRDTDLLLRKLARESPHILLALASTLQEARSCLSAGRTFDAVLLDLHLPDGNGLELLAEIREKSLLLPVIVLTGMGDEAVAVAAFKAGANDYLVKRPGYLDWLPQALETAVSRFCAEKSRNERPITVLYVEHNPVDIELTRRHLSVYAPHIHLKAVYSPKEALSLLHPADGQPGKYDLLLLDYCLPGLSALDVLKVLRQEFNSTLPVVLVTGQGDERAAVQALRLGASDYLPKRQDYLLQLPSVLESAFYHTELVREQAALRKSEARFRRMVENAQDIVFCLQLYPKRHFEYISPAVTAISGFTPEEHYLDFDLLLRAVYPEFRETLNAALGGKVSIDRPLSFPIVSKAGRLVWLEVWGLPTYDQAGRLTALEGIARDVTERKEAEQELLQSREQYKKLADSIADMFYALDERLCCTFWNRACEAQTGLTSPQVIGRTIFEIFGENEPAQQLARELRKSLADQTPRNFELIFPAAEQRRYLDVTAYPMGKNLTVFAKDITGKKLAEEALKESETVKSSIIEAIPDVLVRFGRQGQILDLVTDERYRLRLKNHYYPGVNLAEMLPQDLAASRILFCIEETLETNEVQSTEYALETSTGSREFEARFKACGPDEAVAFIREITDRKRYEEQLKYCGLYDQLTAIYNRAYFEEELQRLSGGQEFPVAVISVDLNGLKLINDTMGHEKGDELLKTCACILKQSLRGSDVLARVGGDEFAAILPRTGQQAAADVVARFNENIARFNQEHPEFPLSVSVGLAVADKSETPLKEILRRADDLMYNDKLMHSKSARSQILTALLTALAERDYLTEGHAQRLTDLSQKLGELAGLSAKQLSALALLAQVHDLGKVGIPDHILNKKGKLNDEEWKIMRQHPEKGYRIAMSSPALAPVADLILKHHEKWDGSGYPLGLAGEDIPVECRILAIADAYDAMTNDRPYSNAKSRDEALEEIKRCKGSQFDPKFAELFISLF
ncbi:MAG: Cyclic di-GMP phosphodiesterase response regulator RpfG [Syntrophomonadaceae bacterium]|nr:Cyclic di-GMP phosphodiesterase response regulator RpfG [Bacillota bacterium]